MNEKEKVACPHCLGTGEEYSPVHDDVQICTLCKGDKKVTVKEKDSYDPLEMNDYSN